MNATMMHRNAILGTVLVGFGLFLFFAMMTKQASAIPAFSRKYQTSCATCHSNYPELNDFGEAFKKNGFKFPKDDDGEEAAKYLKGEPR